MIVSIGGGFTTMTIVVSQISSPAIVSQSITQTVSKEPGTGLEELKVIQLSPSIRLLIVISGSVPQMLALSTSGNSKVFASKQVSVGVMMIVSIGGGVTTMTIVVSQNAIPPIVSQSTTQTVSNEPGTGLEELKVIQLSPSIRLLIVISGSVPQMLALSTSGNS